MSMLAAQISEWGSAPKATQAPAPPRPVDDSIVQIRVIAAGLHQVTRSRAEGKHYSSVSLPHTPGIDGTGIDVKTGKLVYFVTLGGEEQTGSFAELVNVPRRKITELPPNVDVVQAAALINPVMSSWMALRTRVDFIKYGTEAKPWSCFILGATSMSGRIAIKVARRLGATRIVGAARNEAILNSLGLDATIVIQDSPEKTDFAAAADVDVVLDYLYGPYFTNFFTSPSTLKAENPLTWVCIGAVAGNFGTVASAALRKRDVTIRGAGVGAWSPGDLVKELPSMVKILEGVKEDEVHQVKLENVESQWGNKEGRMVFVMGNQVTGNV